MTPHTHVEPISRTMSSTTTLLLPAVSDVQRADFTIQGNLENVRAAIKADTLPSALEPLLIVVSAGRPVEDILTCHEQGQRDFGEDNAQELLEKATKVGPSMT